MATNLICRVKVGGQVTRPEVEFVWFEGSASFPPIVLNHEASAAFRENARDSRQKLFELVSLHVPPEAQRDGAAIRRACFELASVGRFLYNQLLPAHDPIGADVRQWLEDLTRARKVASLELVCDGEPWFAPWNLVYDADPDDGRFDDANVSLDEQFGPFWGIRHTLCASLPVNPLRRNPLPSSPDTLLVIDPVVAQALEAHSDQTGKSEHDTFDAFVAKAREAGRHIRVADSKRSLKQALKNGRPDIMYWFCHADPDRLSLGDDDVTLKDLDNLLNEVPLGKAGSGLVILNACRTAEPGSLGSFLRSFHDRGYCGIIATEERTLDNFANPFGLALLEGVLTPEGTIASLARSLRRKSLPLGLLYGSYCPSNLEVAHPQESRPDEPGLAQAPLANRREAVSLGTEKRPASAGGGPQSGTVTRRWPPLPGDTPYLPLGVYGPEHRALFAGRDQDVERFALLLDHAETRALVLHGESGVGKSSFLRRRDSLSGRRMRRLPIDAKSLRCARRRPIAGSVRAID